MKLKTIDEVLDLAESLNKLMADNVEMTIDVSGIENVDDIKLICNQERGDFFEPCDSLDYHWCYVKIDKVTFRIGNH